MNTIETRESRFSFLDGSKEFKFATIEEKPVFKS